MKKMVFIFLILWAVGSVPEAFAAEVQWKNFFTFYGDNTEFFEPYRTGETLLGQQGKSWLEAALGKKTFLSVGVFGDFRSVTDPTLEMKPILSFEYREGGTQLILGSLDVQDRHGFLEPLEVTTLEFTRPMEYGFQWIEKDPRFQCDFFLNWHQLNTPSEPEQMDYGGVFKEPLDDRFSLEEQFHGFHDGGQLYYIGDIFNNWVPAAGFRWKIPGLLGETRVSAFGVMGGHLTGSDTSQAQWGGGGYLKMEVMPDSNLNFFGIGWEGKDFYSQEGDANYTSFSSQDSTTTDQAHPFVKSDRTYAEIGARRDFPLEGGANFEAEVRVHFIDDSTAYSYRMSVTAPLDLPLLSDSPKKGGGDGDD